MVAATHPGAEELAVAGHVQPQAATPRLEVVAQALAVRIHSQPLSVGSSSSWHQYEEHRGAEIQRQVGAPATLHQMRAGLTRRARRMPLAGVAWPSPMIFAV
jgi:hypothetical protein